MSEVLTNTTPQPNDFAYNVNNDGLHCGPQTAHDGTHTPASTVPVVSNTTPPPPDFPITGGGNLNNDGHNCGPPQPFIPPHPQPPVACRPSFFPTQNTFSALTNASPDSPNRGPGFKSQIVIFNGVAGQSVSIFYRSSAFDCYVYLMDPTNTNIAEDDSSGYDLVADIDNSAIIITLPLTGTYTVDCTTFSPGDIGAFQLQVSAGIEHTATQHGGCWGMVDLPSVGRIQVVSGYTGPTHGFHNTYDALSYSLVNSRDLGPPGFNALIGNQNIWLNTSDHTVWAMIRPTNITADDFWNRVDPTSGLLLEPVFDSGMHSVNNSIYIPSRNKVYARNDLFTPWMRAYDLSSRTFILHAINFGTNDQQNINGVGYDAVNNVLIVNVPGHATYKVSSDDSTITPFISPQIQCQYNFPVVGRTMYGVLDGSEDQVIAANLDSGATSVLFSSGTAPLNGPSYNPCLDCIEVITNTNTSIQPSGAPAQAYQITRYDRQSGSFVESKLFMVLPNTSPLIGNVPFVVWNSTDNRGVIIFQDGFLTVP